MKGRIKMVLNPTWYVKKLKDITTERKEEKKKKTVYTTNQIKKESNFTFIK